MQRKALGTIFCPGSGLGFWYQFGQLHGLLSTTSTIQPQNVRQIGVSAGALAISLVNLGISFDTCVSEALRATKTITGNETGNLSLTSGRSQVLPIVETWLNAIVPKEISKKHIHNLHNVHLVALNTKFQHVTFTGQDLTRSRQDLIDILLATVSIPGVLTLTPKHIVPANEYCFDALKYYPGIKVLRISSPPVRKADPETALKMFFEGVERGKEKQELLGVKECELELNQALPFPVSSAWRSINPWKIK